MCQSLFYSKVKGCCSATFLKILRHKYFAMKLFNFSEHLLMQKRSRRRLLAAAFISGFDSCERICKSSRPKVFCKNAIFENFTKFTGKHQWWSCLFLVKLQTVDSDNLIKQRLQHNCFPVNFANFLRAPILQNICGQLLINVAGYIITGAD